MNVEQYCELQDKTIQENKDSYKVIDGVKYINIANCNRMYWNATSICETLADDLRNIDKRICYLQFSRLNKMLCRIINTSATGETDKKVKDWIIRNYKNYLNSDNNRELNRLIRGGYVFYFDNRHGILYK